MMKVSIYQRDGSTKWWVRYRDADGKLVRESTGTEDEEVARHIAERIEQKLAAEYAAKAYGQNEANDVTDESDLSSVCPDPVLAGIDNIEELMLSIAQHQAQGQEVSAKRIANVLRQLAERTQRLEYIIDRVLENQDRSV